MLSRLLAARAGGAPRARLASTMSCSRHAPIAPATAAARLALARPAARTPLAAAASMRAFSHSALRATKSEPPPRGFGNFFGKDAKSASKKSSSSSASESEEDGGKKQPKKDDEDGKADKGKKKKKDDKQSDEDADGEPSGPKKPPQPPIPENSVAINVNAALSLLVSLALLAFFTSNGSDKGAQQTTFQEFRASMLDRGAVDRVEIVNKSTVLVYLRPDAPHFAENPSLRRSGHQFSFTISNPDAFESRLDEAQRELGIPSRERLRVTHINRPNIVGALLSFAPTLLLLGGLIWMSRRTMSGGSGGPGGILGMGKSRAKMFNQENQVTVKFKDVAGVDEAKEEIMEFVKFLKDPTIYEKLGAKIPRGAILSGPPGTGKTLLAKATAGEAGVPFFSVSGSEFVEMFVGVGASRVRDLFSEARKHAPCIIFIDEIDAIGKARGRGGSFGGNDERESTLNQILVEIDGFGSSEHVVILAGTNRPDVLDAALMRPGRFDRHITIDRPDINGRQQIFRVHLGPIKVDPEQDMDRLVRKLAALTPGFAGADIHNVCNEAALVAARYGASCVTMAHFEQAIERVIAGLEKKSKVLSPEEKKIVAYHEAGHAVVGWYMEHTDPLLKVSIIPRGSGALGYAQYLPKDLHLHSTEQLRDRVCMTLGGRAAEQVFFESITTGAHDDLKKVTGLTYRMITELGMNAKVGQLAYPNSQQEQSFTKPYSEETARLIDEEARVFVADMYQRTVDLITKHRDDVEKVAQELLAKEVISRDDMVTLLGKRPFKDRNVLEDYVEGKSEFNA
ncbi:AAA ATPase afg3 [Blastocladiella emersonii ATCC 22665]|nr:AAA ATPase afg3 [Blastocladiella emersonii ATCC 22665]